MEILRSEPIHWEERFIQKELISVIKSGNKFVRDKKKKKKEDLLYSIALRHMQELLTKGN